jgi:hypothetical protein
MGVLAHVDLDSGSGFLPRPGNGGSLRLAEWELPDDFGLGVMPGIAWQHNDNGERYTSGIFGIVLGKELNERSRVHRVCGAADCARPQRRLALHLRFRRLLPADRYRAGRHRLSRGLNRRTPDWSWTVGLSLKF